MILYPLHLCFRIYMCFYTLLRLYHRPVYRDALLMNKLVCLGTRRIKGEVEGIEIEIYRQKTKHLTV